MPENTDDNWLKDLGDVQQGIFREAESIGDIADAMFLTGNTNLAQRMEGISHRMQELCHRINSATGQIVTNTLKASNQSNKIMFEGVLAGIKLGTEHLPKKSPTSRKSKCV